MYCTKCKRAYSGEERFCEMCGEKLVSNAEGYANAFKNGDETAFEMLYKESFSIVKNTAYYYVRAEELEDCIQEIYIKIYKNIGKYDPQKGNIHGWIKNIAKNCAIDHIRRMSQEEVPGEEKMLKLEDPQPIPEIIIEQNETARLIQEILTDITDEQRTCILLYYMGNLKQKEIAEELGISENTVKSRLRLGKDKIENRVLELEKKYGTKLYGLAPFTFFLALAKCQESYVAQNAWAGIEKAVAAFRTGAVSHAAGGTSGTASTGSGSAAGTLAAKTATMTGKSIAVKVIAGITAAAVIGVSGYTGYQKYEDYRLEKQAEEARAAAKAQKEKELAELKSLEESIDYEYLKNIFMAMPCYTDIDTVSDDTLSSIITSTLLYKNIELEGIFGEAIAFYPVWIEDDEVISFDTAEGALPVERQFQSGGRYSNIVVKNTAYDKPFTILGYSKSWLDMYRADCEKQYSRYPGEKDTRRFDEESFAIYTGGRGGGSEYESEFLDTAIDEEKKCVRITFRYSANIMGRLTEEERIAEIISADNPYGYVIQSITKVQEDKIPEIDAENTQEESNEVNTENVQTEESPNSYAEELFGMLPENFRYDAQMGNYGVRLSVKDDGGFTGSWYDGNGDAMMYCEFQGSFSHVKKVNDTTYSAQIEGLEMTASGVENPNQITYEGPAEIPGFAEGDEILFYLPGTAVSELSDDYVNCVSWFTGLESKNVMEQFGIHNVTQRGGMVSVE